MPKWKRIAQALPHWRDLRKVFDAEFYLAKYPDVARAGVNPFRHYVEYGAAEGRKPHPLFDPEYYLLRSGLARSFLEVALKDFLGRRGGDCINSHPLFDCASYLAAHPDAAEGNVNPLMHYVLSKHAASQNEVASFAEIASFIFMDVPLRIAFVKESAARERLPENAVVRVWEDSSGRMQFIAPPEQRPFFEAMKYDQLRAQMFQQL
jgi:hypothetical protein